MAPVVEMFKNQIAANEKTDSELKLRQAELMQLMAQEQSCWTEFNAQLEAFEKARTDCHRAAPLKRRRRARLRL